MGGFVFRTGVRLKDFGERHGLGWLVRLGLAVREAALSGKAK
jgi:hypothetical protein